MKINIKKLNELAEIPKYAIEGSACFDLKATSVDVLNYGAQVKCGTGLAFEIPKGYKGLIYPRSSIVKTGLRMGNSVGVIDHGYNGEVTFVFDVVGDIKDYHYKVGDRIGQMEIVPVLEIEFNEITELKETARGTGGYGSSGLN